MTDKVLAWHFCRDDMRLGYEDDRLIVPGKTLSVKGSPTLCHHGLHGSERVVDALNYAPGFVACRVEIWGDVIRANDKLVGTHRKTLYAINAKPIILEFAKCCALQVIDKWDAPQVVLDFLNGDDSLVDAARAAASAARAAAAYAAAHAAAYAAADAAADAADAARAAASAARAAAYATSAAYAPTSAARAAAYAATSAAYAATSATSATSATYAAAYAAQNEKLTAMIEQAVDLQL